MKFSCPSNAFFSSCALLFAALITGCATAPSAPAPKPVVTAVAAPAPTPKPGPAVAPVTPTPSTHAVTPPPGHPTPDAAAAATIVGSEESSALLDNFTAFVVGVDGRSSHSDRDDWNTPVSLSPGRHLLKVEFNRGKFTAGAEMEIFAKPGGTYQLLHSSDAQIYGKSTYCEFWIIETGSGIVVSPAKRAAIKSKEG